MWSNLNLIMDFLFTCWDQIIVLYFAGGIFSTVFSIWILKKIARLIKKLG